MRKKLAGCLLMLAMAACARTDSEVRQATSQREAPARSVALTFDDLPLVSTVRDTTTQWAVNRGILAALRERNAPAIGFVNEGKLGAGGVRRARIEMLQSWLAAGHDLGNHTWSHADIDTSSLDGFVADIVRGEEATTQLRGSRPIYFRHPFLRAGRDSARKFGLDRALSERGYRVAPVTIDNQEYIFARAYDRALDENDEPLARHVADAYVTYMDTIVGFYEAQSRLIVGREFPQVLLLHANRINGDHLPRILSMLEARGYRFITLEDALRDSAYRRPDRYVGRAGITWLHRWALTAGLPSSTFRGEPVVPEFVMSAFQLRRP